MATVEKPSPAAASEIAQLREVIEKQPACLVRVSLDGTLLAVNEAALSILGAENLGQVLEQSLAGRFLPGQQKLWDDFSARVWASGAGSVECELADLAGEKRPVLLKGVARRDHHDGIDSLFITIRDTAARLRLEQAVLSAAQQQERTQDTDRLVEVAQQETARLTDALEAAASERAALLIRLEEADAERRRIETASGEEKARLQQTLDQQHRAALAAHGQKAQQLLDHLQEQLATARAEQKRLAAAYEQARSEAASGPRADEARAAGDDESRATIALLQSQVEDLQAQIASLSDQRHQLSAQLTSLQSAERSLREEHEQTLAARELETRQRIAALESQVGAAAEEQRRIESTLGSQREELEAQLREDFQRTLAARESESWQLVQRLEQQLEDVRAALTQREADAAGERQGVETLRSEHDRTLAAIRTETQGRVEQLEARIADLDHQLNDARTSGLHLEADIRRYAEEAEELRRDRDRAVDLVKGENQKQIQQLEAQLEHARETGRQLEAELAAARSAEQLERVQLEQARAAASDLQGQIEQLRATEPQLHADLQQARARERHLESELQQAREAQQRLEGDVRRQADEALGLRKEFEQALEAARVETHGRIQQLEAELAGARHNDRRSQLEAERFRAEGDDLRQRHELALTTLYTETRAQIEQLEAQLLSARDELTHVAVAAQRQRLEADERWRREEDRWRRESEHAFELLRAEHQQALAARDEEAGRVVAQLAIELEAARTDQTSAQQQLERETARIEQQLRDEYQRSLAARKREMLDSINALQAQLDASQAEQQRLEGLLHEKLAAHARGVGELVTERAHAERALAEAVQKKNHALKTLADQTSELQILQENVRALSTLAAAGRLARQVGAELEALLGSLDDRARYLLSLTSLDSVQRDEVEILRKDILRAMVLSQQVAPPAGGVAHSHAGE